MVPTTTETLHDLYESDEPAWLEAMAELIREGRHDDLDYAHLAEYLADMARSDKRRVFSNLALLIAHRLKWQHQPDRRSRSWLLTIARTRKTLQRDLQSGVLLNHAVEVLAEAYSDGVEYAAIETGLPESDFPRDCPFTLESLLAREFSGHDVHGSESETDDVADPNESEP